MVNKREFQGSRADRRLPAGAATSSAPTRWASGSPPRRRSAARPSLTYLYDSDLDWTGHRWGVSSSQWLQQLAMVDAEAEQLREALPASTRLVVVADHGMVDSPDESRVDVDDHADLLDGVALIGGEARFRHLYCRSGAVDDVLAAWSGFLGERATVLSAHRRRAPGLVRTRRRRVCCPAWATSSPPATATSASSRPSGSPTRRRSSACTARSRRTRC